MAKRHQDRKPGERVQRGGGAGRPARGGGSSGGRGGAAGGSSRGGPTRGGPARGGPSRGRGGPSRGAGSAGPSRGPRKPQRSTRRARGIEVTPLPSATEPKDGKVRLNRFLAMAGVCSRRHADEMIAQGRVEVNGEPTKELGLRVDPQHDDVRVDGDKVRQEKPVYVLLNKPKGVVCTNARHEQKKRVIDLLPDVRGRLFTVGRLDLDSEGLLLVTNDGDFAQQMAHPRHGVPKLYSVLLRGRITQQQVHKARGGVWLAEGPTGGMQIKVERVAGDRTYLKVTLREGKNREIRRVFAKLGLPVLELKRIRIGELTLHGLSAGGWRFLQRHEVDGLLAAAQSGDGDPGSGGAPGAGEDA